MEYLKINDLILLVSLPTDFLRTDLGVSEKVRRKFFAKSFLLENQWVYYLNIELGISGFLGYLGFRNSGKPEKPKKPRSHNILFCHMSFS